MYFFVIDDMDSSDDGKDLSEVKQPRPATRPKTRLRIKTAGLLITLLKSNKAGTLLNTFEGVLLCMFCDELNEMR